MSPQQPQSGVAQLLPARFDLSLAWRGTWVSRLLVWAAGIGAVLVLGQSERAAEYDSTHVSVSGNEGLDLLLAPALRWDGAWFTNIATDGYGSDPLASAFFPLYPALMALIGWPLGSPAVAGTLISIICLWGGLTLISRLMRVEGTGTQSVSPAIWALCLFPTSVFLSAIYSESLFLLLSAGAFLAARQDRWLLAGTLGALAAATRSAGILLVVPLLVFAWTAVRSGATPWRRILWIALVPLGLAAVMLWFWWITGDPMASFSAQQFWGRSLDVPFIGVWQGVVAAKDSLILLSTGSVTGAALQNLISLGFLVGAVLATIGVFRRLPMAYGVYTVVYLALPLSTPAEGWPLMSLPRFLIVCFPLFMWLGIWLSEGPVWRRQVTLALFAVALAGTSAWFATWRFVA